MYFFGAPILAELPNWVDCFVDYFNVRRFYPKKEKQRRASAVDAARLSS